MLNRLQGVLLWGALLLSASVSVYADPIQEANKLFKQGDSAQALDKIEQFLVEKPKSAPAQFLKGLILTEQNKTEEAIKVFTALNEDFPELPEPYNNLAVLYAGQGQYEKAKTALEMAIHAHPSYVTAHENLGDIYAKLASQSYDRVLQLDHNNAAAKSKLATLQGLFQDIPRSKPHPVKINEKPVEVVIASAVSPTAVIPVVSSAVLPASTVMAASSVPVVAVESGVPAIASSVVATASMNTLDPEKEALKARNSEVMSSVNAWVSAWENKQVKKYVACYANDFKPSQKGLTRAKWADQRKTDIEDSNNIQISISRAAVSFSDTTHATVKFQQSLKFGKMRKAKLSRKTLTMVKSGGKWLILEEKAK
ncbi:MAG: tetratricopeptide repeat protein [Gallionella sp.]|nr:tetratricopeptide repeat protein [Gallionella sp.]